MLYEDTPVTWQEEEEFERLIETHHPDCISFVLELGESGCTCELMNA